jgi:hypothetical protein
MTSFYKCSCGYTTKNDEYANFHCNNDGCKAVKYDSAFDGNGGLIAMVRKNKTTKFVKWYDTEETLLDAYPDAKFRYSYDCDREFIKMITNAVHAGIISTYDVNCPIVRNDSAERLFKNIDDFQKNM